MLGAAAQVVFSVLEWAQAADLDDKLTKNIKQSKDAVTEYYKTLVPPDESPAAAEQVAAERAAKERAAEEKVLEAEFGIPFVG